MRAAAEAGNAVAASRTQVQAAQPVWRVFGELVKSRSRQSQSLSVLLVLCLALQVLGMAGCGAGAARLNYDPSWRKIQFSGRTWVVKDSGAGFWGPGPNRWSSSSDNVWVDGQGHLHMKVTNASGQWYAAEVITAESLGFGRYEWEIGSAQPDNPWEPNAVLGLFTWSDEPAYTHREIDVEVAKWSDPNRSSNSQFVVQPHGRSEHLKRFRTAPVSGARHSFTWRPNRVDFLSTWDAGRGNITWSFANGTGRQVPQAGGENARINLWLTPNSTVGPQTGQEIEVVVVRFAFTSLAQFENNTAASTSAAGTGSIPATPATHGSQPSTPAATRNGDGETTSRGSAANIKPSASMWSNTAFLAAIAAMFLLLAL
eukprot:scpid79739/ scgid18822/ 